ncbi:MAG: hypothetical protein ACI9OJ_001195 [Myxococcota bacterium]|jgi:hypothetical protein
MFEFLDNAWDDIVGAAASGGSKTSKPSGQGYKEQADSLKPAAGRATTTSALKMRDAPSPEGGKILTIPAGERVDVLSQGVWWQVRFNGQTGYSHGDFLAIDNTGPTQNEEAKAKPADAKPEHGDAVETDAAETDGAAVKKASALKKQKYTVSSTKEKVVKANAKEGRAEVLESPQTYCNAILKKAGHKPEEWYGNFTKITFLGRKINAPIHMKLAEHLRSVEATFATKYGDGDAKAAGDALGLTTETITGSRESPTSAAFSMHLLGLAIDLDYTHNPYIGTSSNPVFKRAGSLVDGAPGKYKSGMSYDDLSTLDKTTTTYFSYLEEEVPLTAALKTATEMGVGPWANKSVKDARKLIEADLTFVRKTWSRNGTADKRSAVKNGGFMNLSKNLVEGIGLDWGGSYGDMMHFDMRNKAPGSKIRRAIVNYKKAKIAESVEAAKSE